MALPHGNALDEPPRLQRGVTMSTYHFSSFGHVASGQLVTSGAGWALVYASNPYGGYNLVVVDMTTDEAVGHGNAAALGHAFMEMPRRAYRRARAFLAARGVASRWFIGA